MISSKFHLSANAVHTNGRAFNVRNPVVGEFRLQSLTRTVTGGTTISYIMQSAAERSALVDRVKAMGGSCSPMILGIMFRVFQTVTVPAQPAGTGQASASIYERRALDTINLNPGKAGSAYFMGRTPSFGLAMAHMEKCGQFSNLFRAARSFCSDTQTTAFRVRQDDNGGGVFSALDNQSNTLARPFIEDRDMRRIYNGATGVVTPENFTPAADLMFLPLTADGTYGVTDAGITFDELFSAQDQWIINYTPANNVDLYPSVAYGGAATVFGSFTVEVSLLYRVHDGAQTDGETPLPPSVGDVYQWNADAGTIPDGTAQNIAGELTSDHAFVGYLPKFWDANVDSGKFYWAQVDTTATAPYYAKIRLVWPKVNPVYLNTDSKYVRVGDGVVFSLPPGGNDQLARANEALETWNARFRQCADHDGFDPYARGVELQTFGDFPARSTATSTLASTCPIYYGTTPASLVSTLTPSTYDDSSLVVSLGGLAAFPLAWSDRGHKAGFAGVATRAHDDKRAIQVTTMGGFTLPKIPQGASETPDKVQVWRYMGPYADFSGGECHPCGTADTKPVVINPASANAALGASLSVSSILPVVDVMAAGTPLKTGK